LIVPKCKVDKINVQIFLFFLPGGPRKNILAFGEQVRPEPLDFGIDSINKQAQRLRATLHCAIILSWL
jgi:hypothetical protein